MTALHQIVPTVAGRDAVGQHVLQVQRALRGAGLKSDIFTEFDAAPGVRHLTRSIKTFGDVAGDRDAVLMYQASTGSTLVEWLLDQPQSVLVNYHNVTPPEFFAPWEPAVEAELRVGRLQIADLAPVTELAIAVSDFNAVDLAAMGFQDTAVIPILLDVDDFAAPVDPGTSAAIAARKERGGTEWLFVGRIAPNKCQHDIIKAFAYYRAAYDDHAHLTLVGRSSSHRYQQALARYVSDLGLLESVTFADSVSAGALASYYEGADVFVCLSEHEGFCVPILESLYHGVPVVAFAAAAVPATLGSAGVVSGSKEPSVIAAAVARVVEDGALRADLVSAGTARLAAFDASVTRASLLDVLSPYII